MTQWLKYLLNGSKLPNWVKFVALGTGVGWHAMTIVNAQERTTNEIRAEIRRSSVVDSLRSEELERAIVELKDTVERRTRQGDRIHTELWDAIRQPGRARPLE